MKSQIVSFSCLFALVSATWFLKEAKVCNPKQEGILPFTGFKVYRQYTLQGYKAQSNYSLSLAHCDHGKLDYEKRIPTSSSIDIDWSRPFCILKPELGKKLPSRVSDTVYSLVQEKDVSNKTEVKINEKKIEEKHSAWQVVKNKMDDTLDKMITGKRLKYVGKKTQEHVNDIMISNPQASIEWESRNLVCYKMARRRKYAKRNILFYVPQTFVGGLFECPITKEKKKEIFQNFTASDFLRSFDFKCDSSISIPISPLIAEDTTKQWIEPHINPFKPKLIQKIPYLSTSTVLNLRFSTSNTVDMYADTWASEIDVNEDYVYSSVDLNLISQALSLSTDYIHKNFHPFEVSNYISTLAKVASYAKGRGKFMFSFLTRMLSNTIEPQSTDIMLSLNNSNESISHISKLQNIWDNIITDAKTFYNDSQSLS